MCGAAVGWQSGSDEADESCLAWKQSISVVGGRLSGGRLVLVGTPIGNLGDLSPRASAMLAEADVVCCEDTRRTGLLLARTGSRGGARLLRVDDHTEESAAAEVAAELADGCTVALVSDAGMPSLCDPGRRIVAAAAAAGHSVTVVPGPSAGIAALVASGLPAARHVFEGFLPRRGAARSERLAEIAGERRTVVLFEAPHRLHACLVDLAEACGADRRAVIARELTKMHEQLIRGTLDELREWASKPVKGETVVVLEGARAGSSAPSDAELESAIAASLRSGASRRDTAKDVAHAYGVPRRRVYELVIAASGGPARRGRRDDDGPLSAGAARRPGAARPPGVAGV